MEYYLGYVIATFLIAQIIISSLFYLVSLFEGIKSTLKIGESNRRHLKLAIKFILIIIVFYFFYWLKSSEFDDPHVLNNHFFLLKTLIYATKIVMAFIVSHYAHQQNRNKYLWFFLGLISFISALIALGLSKSIHSISAKYEGKLKELKIVILEKKEAFKSLSDSGFKSKKEIQSEINHLENKYNLLIDEYVIQSEKDHKLEILENALKKGVDLSPKNWTFKIREIGQF